MVGKLRSAAEEAQAKELEVSAFEYLYKPLSRNRVAVLLINHAASTTDLVLSFKDVPGLSCSTCKLRDVYEQKDIGVHSEEYVAKAVGSRDSAFFIISGMKEEVSASQ